MGRAYFFDTKEDEIYWNEDGAMVVRLDCDEDGVTIDPNDPYLD